MRVAVHWRGRALRRAHPARRDQVFGTVIRHARRCAFAQSELAIALSMIGEPLWRSLVASASCTLLRGASRHTTRVFAVSLAAKTRPAHREQAVATTASLKTKRELAVHRPAVVTPTNLPTSSASSIVSSSRCPSAEGLGVVTEALDLFGVRADANRNGEIFDAASFPPISRDTRQNTTGSSCHQHMRKAFVDVLKRIEVKRGFSSHGLRRTANDLLRRVSTGEVTRAITGHMTVAMTDRYSHVDLDEKKAATSSMLRLVRGDQDGDPDAN